MSTHSDLTEVFDQYKEENKDDMKEIQDKIDITEAFLNPDHERFFSADPEGLDTSLSQVSMDGSAVVGQIQDHPSMAGSDIVGQVVDHPSLADEEMPSSSDVQSSFTLGTGIRTMKSYMGRQLMDPDHDWLDAGSSRIVRDTYRPGKPSKSDDGIDHSTQFNIDEGQYPELGKNNCNTDSSGYICR